MAKRDNNGKFMKGESPNPKGRPKGAKNKLTRELRAILKTVVHNELEELPKTLKELPPKERLELLVKLLPYTLPKVQPASHSFDEPIDFGNLWG